MHSVWSTHQTFDPDATRYEEEEGGGEGEGEMETEVCEDMEVTDIDEYSPVSLMKQTARIPGMQNTKLRLSNCCLKLLLYV